MLSGPVESGETAGLEPPSKASSHGINRRLHPTPRNFKADPET